MKSFIAFVHFIICALLATAQQGNTDSRLDHLPGKPVADTAWINQELKKISRFQSIDSALVLCKTIIESAKKINYREGEAAARQRLAAKQNMKGDYPQAAVNLAVAKNIYESLSDSLGLNHVFSTYGMMFGMQSKYDSSIRYFEAAIGVAERNGYHHELSGDYGNIAISYQMQSNFAEALRYQQKAFTLAKTRNDIDDQAYASLNMGLTYFALGDSNRAEQAYIESVTYAKSADEKAVELYAYSNLSDLYLRKNQPQKAFDHAMKAATLGNEMGDQGIEAASLSKASRSLTQMKKFSEAETLARHAIAVADSSSQPLNIYQANSAMGILLKTRENYKQAIPFFEKGIAALQRSDIYDEAVGLTNYDLSVCYEKTGDFHNALTVYRTGSQILDSVRSRENIRKATELNMNYEYEKKQEAQRIEQKQKDANAKERQVALLIGLGLTLVLAIVAFSAFRIKQKANGVLKAQKQEIERTLARLEAAQKQLIQSEKMASLGELTAGIAHEIQNPLNFVNNFSEVSNDLIDEMNLEISTENYDIVKGIAADLKLNLGKISHHGQRAAGIVNSMLQHSRGGTSQKQPTNINRLADEYLRLAYHGQRAKDKNFNVATHTSYDDNVGTVELIPQDIGRVILNLVTNAFYAVSEKQRQLGNEYDPVVSVSTKRMNNTIEIRVEDNGNGVPDKILDKIFQPFFTTKPTGQGTGLGLSLSYDIVTKSHGGELKVETKEGEGTAFLIKLSINDD